VSPAELYVAIGRLIEDQPDIDNRNELLRWLGRAHAILGKASPIEAAGVKSATDFRLERDSWGVRETTNAALYRALAAAELEAPVSLQGSFIPSGNTLDAMAAVGKILSAANTRVRLVDPYMDDKALTDFAVLAAEGVDIELLSDGAHVKPSFLPAVGRFKEQFGESRPLVAKLTPQKVLHDRLVIVDGKTVYTVTQSLNALAARSHASIVRIDGEAVQLKIAAYNSYWDAASEL
jgi:hypothetical protein